METRNRRPDLERRVVTSKVRLQKRDAGDDDQAASKMPHIVGHAAVFNTWTTLYSSQTYTWKERVNPGAFRNALAEKQDVRALWNHDECYVLGRTKSGTLVLSEDDAGLMSDCDPPDTELVRDLACAPIARGDVDQMSFAFMVRKGGEIITLRTEGDMLIEERELTDLDLYDVSPVTYAAYEETDVALCTQAQARERAIRSKLSRTGRMRMRSRLSLSLSQT